MFKRPLAVTALTIASCIFVSSSMILFHFAVEEAVAQQARPLKKNKLPDLKVRQYQFVPTNDKALRVQIVNYGSAASDPCRLELTVRKIKDTPVGRTMHQTIPAIRGGTAEAWVTINAEEILPKNVSLADTTFKLIADSTNLVAESDEENNVAWHNLE